MKWQFIWRDSIRYFDIRERSRSRYLFLFRIASSSIGSCSYDSILSHRSSIIRTNSNFQGELASVLSWSSAPWAQVWYGLTSWAVAWSYHESISIDRWVACSPARGFGHLKTHLVMKLSRIEMLEYAGRVLGMGLIFFASWLMHVADQGQDG